MLWLFTDVAFAVVTTNTAFSLTQSAFLSGGGAGGAVSVSENFILRFSKIGEIADTGLSNGRFTLVGGMRPGLTSTEDELLRIHVRGRIDDPTATVYVNEVCAVNQGESWIAPFVTVHEGLNYLYVNAFDPQGNIGGMTVAVTVDTHPPAMPTARYIPLTQAPTERVSGTKEADGELWVHSGELESPISGFSGLTNWFYEVSLEEGRNHFEFFARDIAGNRSAAFPVNIVLDTDAVMFEVISPTDGARTQSATVDVRGKIYDETAFIAVNGAAVSIRQDGSFFEIEGVHLPQIGTNEISIHAQSVTGFAQDIILNVIRDDMSLLPPTINALPAFVGATDLNAGGSCDVDGHVSIRVDARDALPGVPEFVECARGRWNSFLGLTVGENLITVEGRDALGRMVAGEGAIVFSDVTPPTAPAVSDGGATQSSTAELRVSFFSYERETAIVEYQYDFGGNPFPPAHLNFHTTDTSGVLVMDMETHHMLPLRMGETYYIYLRAQNAAGLWSKTGASDGIKISDNQLPMILMLEPATGEFRYPGETINWRLVVHDADDDILQFKYALNGQTVFHFSEIPERTFPIPIDMFGRQQVLGVARDDPQNTFQEWPSASTSFYVAKRPIEP